MTLTTLVVAGDSLTQNTVGEFDIAEGGPGGWAEIVTERFANLPTIGPLLTSGYRHVGQPEWSYIDSWTDVTTSDAFDVIPYGAALGVGKYSSAGSAAIATATRPVTYRPVVGFMLYYVDTPSTGDWQYRIDSGSWTNMGQTIAHDNKLHKFYVDTAVSTRVDIRAYNGTTAVEVLPAGIEWCYTDPRGTHGLVVHNIAMSGTTLHNLVTIGGGSLNGNSTSTTGGQGGDGLSFFDSVVLGTGSPTSNVPNGGVIFLHVNDVGNAVNVGGITNMNKTKMLALWNTDIRALYARVSSLGPVGIIQPWEVYHPVFGGATTQSDWRAQTHTTATALSVSVLDMYTTWLSLGFSATAQQDPDSTQFLLDGTHPNAAGMVDIQERVYRWCPFTFSNQIGVYANPKTMGSSQMGSTDEFLGAMSGTTTSADTASVAETVVIALSSADTVAAVDAVTSIGTSGADNAAPIAETQALAAALTEADTMAVVDAVSPLALSQNDTVAVVDAAVSADATVSGSDTASVLDFGTANAEPVTDTDVAAISEGNGSIAAQVSSNDTNVVAETAAVAVAITDGDTTSVADDGSLANLAATSNDNATVTETELVAIAVSDADVVAALEDQFVVPGVTDSELLFITEGESIVQVLPDGTIAADTFVGSIPI